MSNVSITSYVGWPTYGTFFIVLFSSRLVYDPNPLRPNLNLKNLVSGSCRVQGLGRILTPQRQTTHLKEKHIRHRLRKRRESQQGNREIYNRIENRFLRFYKEGLYPSIWKFFIKKVCIPQSENFSLIHNWFTYLFTKLFPKVSQSRCDTYQILGKVPSKRKHSCQPPQLTKLKR